MAQTFKWCDGHRESNKLKEFSFIYDDYYYDPCVESYLAKEIIIIASSVEQAKVKFKQYRPNNKILSTLWGEL